MPPPALRMHCPSFYLKKGSLQLDENALIGRVSCHLAVEEQEPIWVVVTGLQNALPLPRLQQYLSELLAR